jgi:predicted peptidase
MKGNRMFKKKTAEESALDKAIAQVFKELETMTADAPEYERAVNQLEKFYKMKASEKSSSWMNNSLTPVAGNLAGILLILGFEKFNVITSKAMQFVIKSKV